MPSPAVPYTFTYVRIPADDDKPYEELTGEGTKYGDSLLDILKPKFAGGSIKNADGLRAEYGAAVDEKMSQLNLVAAAGSVEVFALVRPASTTRPVAHSGTYFYLGALCRSYAAICVISFERAADLFLARTHDLHATVASRRRDGRAQGLARQPTCHPPGCFLRTRRREPFPRRHLHRARVCGSVADAQCKLFDRGGGHWNAARRFNATASRVCVCVCLRVYSLHHAAALTSHTFCRLDSLSLSLSLSLSPSLPLSVALCRSLRQLDSGSVWLRSAPSENEQYHMAMGEYNKAAKEATAKAQGVDLNAQQAETKAVPGSFKWQQTSDDVEVTVALPEGTAKRDVTVALTAKRITVKMKSTDAAVAEIDLFAAIRPDESTWTFGADKASSGGLPNVAIMAEKADCVTWNRLEAATDGKIL